MCDVIQYNPCFVIVLQYNTQNALKISTKTRKQNKKDENKPTEERLQNLLFEFSDDSSVDFVAEVLNCSFVSV